MDTRNLRKHGFCSGGNDNVICMKVFPAFLAVYLYSLISADRGSSLDKINVIFRKKPFYAFAVLDNRAPFILLHFPKIKGNKISRYAKIITVLHHGKNIGCMQKGLCRDTSSVDADPS